MLKKVKKRKKKKAVVKGKNTKFHKNSWKFEFLEKFLERPPLNLYSPNTKWNFRPKFRNFQDFDVISRNCQNSRKNFSYNFLSIYVLLIQSGIFGQNFEISKNLTSFPGTVKILGKIFRTTSYQFMFS